MHPGSIGMAEYSIKYARRQVTKRACQRLTGIKSDFGRRARRRMKLELERFIDAGVTVRHLEKTGLIDEIDFFPKRMCRARFTGDDIT